MLPNRWQLSQREPEQIIILVDCLHGRSMTSHSFPANVHSVEEKTICIILAFAVSPVKLYPNAAAARLDRRHTRTTCYVFKPNDAILFFCGNRMRTGVPTRVVVRPRRNGYRSALPSRYGRSGLPPLVSPPLCFIKSELGSKPDASTNSFMLWPLEVVNVRKQARWPPQILPYTLVHLLGGERIR